LDRPLWLPVCNSFFLKFSRHFGGYKDARYLIAASIDRYLTFTEGGQLYGTNRLMNQETGKEEWVPIDRNVSDSERAKSGVLPLAELLKPMRNSESKILMF
jgi:hypothetical protein